MKQKKSGKRADNKNAAAAREAAVEIAAETMLGDLMRVALDTVKSWPKPWPAMSQAEQDSAIFRARMGITEAVTKAAHIIAAQGREVMVAQLEQVSFKDEIKAVLLVGKHDEARHSLADSVGRQVLIVVGGAEDFLGGADQHKAEPDQRRIAEVDKV